MRVQLVSSVLYCLSLSNAFGGDLSPYTGQWEYRQRNDATETGYDDEGEKLQLSEKDGRLEGVYFGLEREGEHGLFYSVVKTKDLNLTKDGGISFVVPERDLFSKRPASLAETEEKNKRAGHTQYEMKMQGKIEKGRLILSCVSTGGECPDEIMIFESEKCK